MKAWGANEIRDLGSPRPELKNMIILFLAWGLQSQDLNLKELTGAQPAVEHVV